jgi:hypothetical protein
MDNAKIKTWRERLGFEADFPLHAATNVESAMVAEIADRCSANEDAAAEILVLHRRIAAETLRANQGWERAEAKSKECIELRERMGRGVEPALDRAAILAEAVALLPSIMTETFKRNDCTDEFLNGMAYGAAQYCSAIKTLADPSRPNRFMEHRWSDAEDAPASDLAQVQDEEREVRAAFAMAWDQALSDAAFYVAGHCVDGDHHADIIMAMQAPALTFRGSAQAQNADALVPQPDQSEASDAPAPGASVEQVEAICDAYESGVGHGLQCDGHHSGSAFANRDAGMAYEIGYQEGESRASAASRPNPMCEHKTDHIIERDGYEKTGYVLKKAGERICVSDGGAVAWFTLDQWNWMMFNRDHVEFQWPKPIGAQPDQRESGVVPDGWSVVKSDDEFLGTAIRISNRREGFATLRPDASDPGESVLFRYFDRLAADPSPAIDSQLTERPSPVKQADQAAFTLPAGERVINDVGAGVPSENN